MGGLMKAWPAVLLLGLGMLLLVAYEPEPDPHLLAFRLMMSREACGDSLHPATFNAPMDVEIHVKVGAEAWKFWEIAQTDSSGIATSYIPASRTLPTFAKITPPGPRACVKVWRFEPVRASSGRVEGIK